MNGRKKNVGGISTLRRCLICFNSNKISSSDISYFQLPANPTVAAQWFRNLNRNELIKNVIQKQYYTGVWICSQHFPKDGIIINPVDNQPVLVKGTLPMVVQPEKQKYTVVLPAVDRNLIFCRETPPEKELIYFREQFKKYQNFQNYRIHCTTCDVHINLAPLYKDNIPVHPFLKVIQCEGCYNLYSGSAPNSVSKYLTTQCKCGVANTLVKCYCAALYCKVCYWRNSGAETECLWCTPTITLDLRALQWAVFKVLDYKYKTFTTHEKYKNYTTERVKMLLEKDLSGCCGNAEPVVPSSTIIAQPKVALTKVKPLATTSKPAKSMPPLIFTKFPGKNSPKFKTVLKRIRPPETVTHDPIPSKQLAISNPVNTNPVAGSYPVISAPLNQIILGNTILTQVVSESLPIIVGPIQNVMVSNPLNSGAFSLVPTVTSVPQYQLVPPINPIVNIPFIASVASPPIGGNEIIASPKSIAQTTNVSEKISHPAIIGSPTSKLITPTLDGNKLFTNEEMALIHEVDAQMIAPLKYYSKKVSSSSVGEAKSGAVSATLSPSSIITETLTQCLLSAPVTGNEKLKEINVQDSGSDPGFILKCNLNNNSSSLKTLCNRLMIKIDSLQKKDSASSGVVNLNQQLITVIGDICDKLEVIKEKCMQDLQICSEAEMCEQKEEMPQSKEHSNYEVGGDVLTLSNECQNRDKQYQPDDTAAQPDDDEEEEEVYELYDIVDTDVPETDAETTVNNHHEAIGEDNNDAVLIENIPYEVPSTNRKEGAGVNGLEIEC